MKRKRKRSTDREECSAPYESLVIGDMSIAGQRGPNPLILAELSRCDSLPFLCLCFHLVFHLVGDSRCLVFALSFSLLFLFLFRLRSALGLLSLSLLVHLNSCSGEGGKGRGRMEGGRKGLEPLKPPD